MAQYLTHELAGMQGSRARAMPNERLIEELHIAHGDGSYIKFLKTLSKT